MPSVLAVQGALVKAADILLLLLSSKTDEAIVKALGCHIQVSNNNSQASLPTSTPVQLLKRRI
jgi:hypothetical protein